MRKQFLFLGIGGMGMAPLALYLRQQGHTIYGFDDGDTALWDPIFEREGIILCTQFPTKIDRIIYSTAITPEHTWRQEASHRGIEQVQRGKLLSKFCRFKKMIAITGSHGKTTTTGQLIDHLPECDYILGSYFLGHKDPARFSKNSPYLICEVDESDRTIEYFHPYITLALNLEDDHLVNYGSTERLNTAFEILFRQTQGVVFYPSSCPRLHTITSQMDHCLSIEDQSLPQAVLHWLHEQDPHLTVYNTTTYTPIARRNQFLGTLDGVDYWSDYAHHPTEVNYCMQYFEKRYSNVAFVFEPHRYTRTAQYSKEFVDLLGKCRVDLLPVYAAGETSLSDGTSETIFHQLPQNHQVRLIPNLTAFHPRKGVNATVFVGAGSIHVQVEHWLREQCIEHFTQWLIGKKISHKTNLPAQYFSSIRTAGQLRLLILPNDKMQLLEVIRKLRQAQLPWMLLGNGTNVLLDDENGVFISLKQLSSEIHIQNNRVTVSANIPLPYFCRCLAQAGIPQVAMLSGIPGTLGGALRMNAGAYGQEIFDHLVLIEALEGDTIKHYTKAEIDYAYRKGYREGIILSAQFEFPSSSHAPEAVVEVVEQYRQKRMQSQPKEPNIGCIFKNPNPQNSAGALIDQCGLKGLCRGDAKVSEKHANFIVNTGQATPEDVKYLIQTCRQRVFEQYGIYLEREILLASDSFRLKSTHGETME